MKSRPALLVLVVALFATLSSAQFGPREIQEEPKLPSGKSQREELLKSEYEKSVKDAAELSRLAEELRSELEKNDSHVLSINALKQLDSIEKLTKRIRSRLKRF